MIKYTVNLDKGNELVIDFTEEDLTYPYLLYNENKSRDPFNKKKMTEHVIGTLNAGDIENIINVLSAAKTKLEESLEGK
ncbi:hypothetical protein [Cognatishimia sp.]|uniref:hypothetical protein n=1 Tax=Cognatishimia sp. TaxID=2211648 RepID=UPI00351308B9|nr:hypothetical protein [Cognatishimia sp.]